MTSAIRTGSPECILASYSCARRDHIARRTRDRPLRTEKTLANCLLVEMARRPLEATLLRGIRSVMRSFSNTTETTSCFRSSICICSMLCTQPTPCLGYTT